MSRFAGYKKYVHSFFLKIKWNLCFSWCHFKKTASVSVLHLDENLHMQSTHRHLQCGKAKSLLLWYFFETVWDINELFNWSSYRYKRLHYFLKIHTNIFSSNVPEAYEHLNFYFRYRSCLNSQNPIYFSFIYFVIIDIDNNRHRCCTALTFGPPATSG